MQSSNCHDEVRRDRFFFTMANDFIYPVTAEGNLIVLNNFKMNSCALFYFGEKCVFYFV